MSDPNLIGGGTAYTAPQPANTNASGYDDDNAAHFRAPQVGVTEYLPVPGQLPRSATYEKGVLQPALIAGNFSSSTLQMLVSNVLPYARIYGMPGPAEAPPGCTGPLSELERAWVQAMLDQGA